jgi:phage terminase large subunit-like protein
VGLRGTGAKKKPIKATRLSSSKQSAWKHKRSRVARVISFLESLPITKGIYAGRKMKLLPSQREFVQAVYGRVSADGRRKIRIAIKSAPRGAGKTGFISGLALAHLLGPECEPRGEIYSAAYNKLQSALMFAEMKAIIEAVPEFEARCNIQRYGKVIEVMEGDGAGSIYESLSADDKRAHGLSPSFWAFDEYPRRPTLICSTTCGRRWANARKVLASSSARRQPMTCTR